MDQERMGMDQERKGMDQERKGMDQERKGMDQGMDQECNGSHHTSDFLGANFSQTHHVEDAEVEIHTPQIDSKMNRFCRKLLIVLTHPTPFLALSPCKPY